MASQAELNDIFGQLKHKFNNMWETNSFIHSGWSLLDKVTDDDQVIDIGCGTNPFKGKIKNLIGIDPTNMGADVVTTIEDYETDDRYDIAFCLGSIQFGDEERITNQINKINSLMKSKASIYWRQYENPANDNVNFFYHWTFEKLAEHAKKHGFRQTVELKDKKKHGLNYHTLYVEWHRG